MFGGCKVTFVGSDPFICCHYRMHSESVSSILKLSLLQTWLISHTDLLIEYSVHNEDK